VTSDKSVLSGSYNCLLDNGEHWSMSFSQIESFREEWLERMPTIRAFSERISRCFWFDLLLLNARYGIWPGEVLRPVLDVENGEPSTGIKIATQFIREPLRGLWHKHWFSARFLPSNLLASANRRDSMDFIWDIAKEGDILTEDIIKQIAHRLTITAFQERSASKKVTGEWIIFLKRGGVNYYLCLGTHQTGDQRILDKITSICSLDFQDLQSWLIEAKQ